MTTSLGLTPRLFFRSLSDEDLRRFIAPEILSVLDPVFGGRVCGEDLQNVVITLVDVDELLREPTGRQLVLRLIPKQKQAELRDRLQLNEDEDVTSCELPESSLVRLREFFGIYNNDTFVSAPSTLPIVVPRYSLFDHQRRAVQRLLPILAQDSRRAVLHLPTGVGKTRTAMHIVAEFLRANEPSVVVWLASVGELLEQAVDAFRNAWSHLGDRDVSVETMWGNRDSSPSRISQTVS